MLPLSVVPPSPNPLRRVSDPRRRFVCHTEGQCKPRPTFLPSHYTAYKGFDKDKGVEVTWHQFKVNDFAQLELLQVMLEIESLKELHHACILSIKEGWLDEKLGNIVIITDVVSASTCIQSFLGKVPATHSHMTSEKVIKRWAYQLCSGISYLHNHEPPLHTHGTLVCSNIYMNGNNGAVKICVLGMIKGFQKFRTFKNNYIAPELLIKEKDKEEKEVKEVSHCPLEREPDSRSDIYALGSCILELVTREVTHTTTITDVNAFYNNLLYNHYPKLHERLPLGQVKSFINRCWDHDARPMAADLLECEWFDKAFKDEMVTEKGRNIFRIARSISESAVKHDPSSVFTSNSPVGVAPHLSSSSSDESTTSGVYVSKSTSVVPSVIPSFMGDRDYKEEVKEKVKEVEKEKQEDEKAEEKEEEEVMEDADQSISRMPTSPSSQGVAEELRESEMEIDNNRPPGTLVVNRLTVTVVGNSNVKTLYDQRVSMTINTEIAGSKFNCRFPFDLSVDCPHTVAREFFSAEVVDYFRGRMKCAIDVSEKDIEILSDRIVLALDEIKSKPERSVTGGNTVKEESSPTLAA